MASVFDPVVLALDTSDARQARAWLQTMPELRRVKVGLQLYLAAGADFVRSLTAEGYWVFLDLKLHDIPNTVAKAVGEVCKLGVGLTTVHGMGGARMIEAAVAAKKDLGATTEIVAVTALTSHSEAEWRQLGFAVDIATSTQGLAEAAAKAGADGIVCSPHEVATMRQRLGRAARLVVPGIRLPGQDAGDQRRIATPAATLQAGASYLVVGRALTDAADIKAALAQLATDLGSPSA